MIIQPIFNEILNFIVILMSQLFPLKNWKISERSAFANFFGKWKAKIEIYNPFIAGNNTLTFTSFRWRTVFLFYKFRTLFSLIFFFLSSFYFTFPYRLSFSYFYFIFLSLPPSLFSYSFAWFYFFYLLFLFIQPYLLLLC